MAIYNDERYVAMKADFIDSYQTTLSGSIAIHKPLFFVPVFLDLATISDEIDKNIRTYSDDLDCVTYIDCFTDKENVVQKYIADSIDIAKEADVVQSLYQGMLARIKDNTNYGNDSLVCIVAKISGVSSEELTVLKRIVATIALVFDRVTQSHAELNFCVVLEPRNIFLQQTNYVEIMEYLLDCKRLIEYDFTCYYGKDEISTDGFTPIIYNSLLIGFVDKNDVSITLSKQLEYVAIYVLYCQINNEINNRVVTVGSAKFKITIADVVDIISNETMLAYEDLLNNRALTFEDKLLTEWNLNLWNESNLKIDDVRKKILNSDFVKGLRMPKEPDIVNGYFMRIISNNEIREKVAGYSFTLDALEEKMFGKTIYLYYKNCLDFNFDVNQYVDTVFKQIIEKYFNYIENGGYYAYWQLPNVVNKLDGMINILRFYIETIQNDIINLSQEESMSQLVNWMSCGVGNSNFANILLNEIVERKYRNKYLIYKCNLIIAAFEALKEKLTDINCDEFVKISECIKQDVNKEMIYEVTEKVVRKAIREEENYKRLERVFDDKMKSGYKKEALNDVILSAIESNCNLLLNRIFSSFGRFFDRVDASERASITNKYFLDTNYTKTDSNYYSYSQCKSLCIGYKPDGDSINANEHISANEYLSMCLYEITKIGE